MSLPRGAFAPIPTPLDSNGNFDAGALRRHLQVLAAAGLDGVLVLGTNGEFPSLTQGERREVAQAAADAPLQKILCVGSSALPDALELTGLAHELGYDAALCPPPFYYRGAPREGIAAFFEAVLDAAQLPVMLYHFPQVIGVPLTDELLDLLAEHPRLAGVKDSSGSVDEMHRLLPRFVGKAYFVGSDRLVHACQQAGGAGSITAAASVVPALVKAVQEGREPQAELDRVRALLEEFGLGPAVKVLLRARGVGEYVSRPPLPGLDPGREEKLLHRAQELGIES